MGRGVVRQGGIILIYGDKMKENYVCLRKTKIFLRRIEEKKLKKMPVPSKYS